MTELKESPCKNCEFNTEDIECEECTVFDEWFSQEWRKIRAFSTKMLPSPCKQCDRNEHCGQVPCLKFKAWYLDTWPKIQKKAGVKL